MPSLALVIGIAFSLWLIVRDVKRRRSVSSAVWIPIITILILATRPLSEWFEISTVQTATLDSEGSPVDAVFYLVVIATSLIVTFLRGVKWNKFLLFNLAIVAFYLYLGLSVLWSDNPLGSFKRWFKDCGYLCLLAVLVSEKDPVEAIRASYVRASCVLLPISVVLVKFYPTISRGYRNTGEMLVAGPTTQKNSLGQMVMLCILFLAWDYLEWRRAAPKAFALPWVTMLLFGMGLWLLYISDSKTAFVCTGVGLILLVRTGRLATSRTTNSLILVGVLSLPFIILFGAAQFSDVVAPLINQLGRDLTFTGRTEIWKHVINYPLNPMFGSGFYNFWGQHGGVEIRRAMREPRLSSSHNGYLELYLDGGILGLALFLLMIAGSGARLINHIHETRYHQLRFALLVLAIVYNLTEAMFARPVLIWFTTLVVLVDFPALKASMTTRRRTMPVRRGDSVNMGEIQSVSGEFNYR